MKKPTCLILTLIGVGLLILGLIFVVPWIVNIYQEFREMADEAAEYMHTLRQDANKPLSAEQEGLLSQLLEVANEMPDSQSPEGLEQILSAEPYLTYLKMHDGQEYVEYPAYLAAMPTETHRSVALSRLGQFLDAELAAAEQEIWVNCYYTMREWSKTGSNQLDNQKEFKELLDEHLTKPLMELHSDTGGFSTKFVKMGMVSALMVTENEVFHAAWQARGQRYGQQEGYLRCAIATPAEFALMRSFFEDAATFQTWMTEPFKVEEDPEEQENK